MRRTPDLDLSLLLKSLLYRKTQDPDDGKFLYGYARQALEDIYRLLELQPGDGVLYPDYICDASLAPCHKLNLKVLYYPLRDNLQPDWESLEKLLKDGAKVVLSVNYFGFPQDLEKWRKIAYQYKVVWIEDNAHGYGSQYKGRELGSFGDMGVSSLRKVLPLLNGAYLHVNEPEYLKRLYSVRLPFSRLRKFPGNEEIRVLIRWLFQWFGISFDTFLKRKKYFLMEPCVEDDHRHWAIDPISLCVFALVQNRLGEYVQKRRSVYKTWENFCVENGLKSVFEQLPSGVSPMVYPCYAKDFEEQQKWLQWGNKNSVDVYPWPSLPKVVRNQRESCIQRWRRLLCFPIHQGLDPEVIRSMRR